MQVPDWMRPPERWYRDLWLVAITGIVLLALNGQAEQGEKIEDSIDANCTVLSVLLDSRADRDQTVDLFAPIRSQNPEQFDRLIERAEEGDERLLAAAPDLSCEIDKRTLDRLRE